MPRVLDEAKSEEVAGLLLDLMEDSGYVPEEFIPGLITAAKYLAAESNMEGQVLDEIVELLEEEEEDE